MAIKIGDSYGNSVAAEHTVSVTLPAGALLVTAHCSIYRTRACQLDGVAITQLLEYRASSPSGDEMSICYALDWAPGTYDLKFKTDFSGNGVVTYAIIEGVGNQASLDTDTDTSSLAEGTVAVPYGGIAIGAWSGHYLTSSWSWDTLIVSEQWNALGNECAIGYSLQSGSGNMSIGELSNRNGGIGVIGIGSRSIYGGLAAQM